VEAVTIMWRNQYEIEELNDRLKGTDLGPWAATLLGWVEIVNRNSDGWPYWKAGGKAASKLADLLFKAADPWNPVEPTTAELKRALTPMKSLATRNGLTIAPNFFNVF
jgi:hypothetical protein